MQNNYCVYRHIAPNGKSYIGITQQQPERRWQNGSGYATQQKFYRAINKYGWDSFEHVILEEKIDKETAINKEKEYIKKYNTINNGYNAVLDYYHTNNPHKTVIQMNSQGDILNIFDSFEEAGRIIGCSGSVVSNWCKKQNTIDGYYWIAIDYNPRQNSLKDQFKNINNNYLQFNRMILQEDRIKKSIDRLPLMSENNKKKINQYTLDGKYLMTFNSIKEASDITGINTINYALLRGKTAGRYQWKYYKGNTDDIEPTIVMNEKRVIQINRNNDEIINEFISMAEAERITGISNKQIWKTCNKKQKIAGGYKWEYAE